MRNNTMNAQSGSLADTLARLAATLVLSAAVVGATGFVTAAAADKKDENKVSKDLAKPLKAAQDALQAKKYPDALAKLKEAEGNPKKTPYDQHVINVLAGSAYARTNDFPDAEKAFEAQANDGFTEASELPRIVKAVAQINYQLKNYDKAIEYGNRAIKNGAGDDEINVIVGQSYYLKGDYKGTLKFFTPVIDGDIKAGRTPKDQQLQLVMSSCVKIEDADCTTKALEKLVTYYPKPDYWKDLLYTLQQDRSQTQSDKNTLQLFRLMSEVDVLARADDYTEMAQLAMEQGSPGEAQHILEKGFQKGIFADQRSKDKNQRLLDQAKKAAVADQASLPKIEKDADAAPTGDKDVGVGLAYLGYQQYDKASDLLSKGLTKGGVKSEPEAHLLLGIAQLKAGHKDDAVKSFHAVKGDAALERLANLWTLHAKQA
jgi:tetratricopeptide (TPR) repeat protein